MTEAQLFNAVGIETKPTEVVFVTNQEKMPHQIGQMLLEEDYAWEKIAVERFITSCDVLGDIGVLVVDTSDVGLLERAGMLEAIGKLEKANTGAILLNDHIDFPFDRFKLATLLKSVSFDELWGRIEAAVKFSSKFNVSDPKARTVSRPEISAEMVEQLKIAGRVQRDFLPDKLPSSKSIRWAAFFEPADWVSGDIYDITRLDEQHIGFYVADAVGHSMPAALLTMFLKQALVMRETTVDDYKIFAPLDVMQKLNKRMVDQHLSGCLFTTCCYGLLNIRTMQMTYCRAGHPYPILVRKGQKPIQLQSQGGLLGVFEDAFFEQEMVQLQQGDKLIIYSDGVESVVGETNDDGNFVFENSFIDILDLPADDLIAAFNDLAKNSKFTGAEVDDMTAIALEIL